MPGHHGSWAWAAALLIVPALALALVPMPLGLAIFFSVSLMAGVGIGFGTILDFARGARPVGRIGQVAHLAARIVTSALGLVGFAAGAWGTFRIAASLGMGFVPWVAVVPVLAVCVILLVIGGVLALSPWRSRADR